MVLGRGGGNRESLTLRDGTDEEEGVRAEAAMKGSESFPNVSVLFQWQRVKCVTRSAPLGDAGAQALLSACLVETTAEKASV